MEVFFSLLEAVEAMQTNCRGHWNSDKVTKAKCFLRAMDYLSATQHINLVSAKILLNVGSS